MGETNARRAIPKNIEHCVVWDVPGPAADRLPRDLNG